MLETLARSLWLALLVLATWRGLAVCLRRRWGAHRPDEAALGAAVLTGLLALAEVVVLGYVPGSLVSRPLDWLLWLHLPVLGAIWLFSRGGCEAATGAPVEDPEPAVEAVLARASRGLLAVACTLYALAGVYAIWSADWLADAINYHVPQVLQPWQDGRLGRVWAEPVWADSYPRGASLIKFWAMRVSGTDAAINLVSWAWGWVFMLGVYVAARRAGLGVGASRLAAALVPTAPIYLLLSGIGYADLDVAACLVAGLALWMPRAGGPLPAASALVGLGAMLLAVLMKFPAVLPAGVLGVMVLVHVCVRRAGIGPRGFAMAALGAALCAAGPYLVAWSRYGSPVWPIRLEVGGWLVFDGPHAVASLTPAHEQFLMRFGVQWSNWLAPLTPDSPGNLGPLFAVAMLFPLMAGVIGAVAGGRRTSFAWWMAAAVVGVVLLGPQLHAGRYGLYLLAPAAIFAAAFFSQFREQRWVNSIGIVLALLMVANVGLWGRGLRIQHELSHPEAAGAADFTVRSKPWLGSGGAADPRWPGPALRRRARELVPAGGLLVSAVHGATTYLHDERYSYRVEFRPMGVWPLDFNKPSNLGFGEESEGEWSRTIRELAPAAVIVYHDSSESNALAKMGYAAVPPGAKRRGEPVLMVPDRPQGAPPGE